MIKNEEGQVAMKYLQTIPHVIQVRDKYYAFVVKANINLSWIDEEDIDIVLNTHRKSCCGGRKNQEYFFANELDVQRWTA